MKSLMQLRLKLATLLKRCQCCGADIPEFDISDAKIDNRLLCCRCREAGYYYEDRCAVCNGARRKCLHWPIGLFGGDWEKRGPYTFEEVQEMHDACFASILNDIFYARMFGEDDLIEKRFLICRYCKCDILRENPECPSCRQMQPIYKPFIEVD